MNFFNNAFSLCQGEDTGWQGSKSTLLLPSSRILVIVRRRCIDRLPRPSATHTHNNHRQQQHQAQKRRRGRGLPNLPGSPPLPSSRVAPPCGRPPIVHVSRSFSLLRSFSHMLHGYGLLAPVRTPDTDRRRCRVSHLQYCNVSQLPAFFRGLTHFVHAGLRQACMCYRSLIAISR